MNNIYNCEGTNTLYEKMSTELSTENMTPNIFRDVIRGLVCALGIPTGNPREKRGCMSSSTQDML